MKIEYKRIEENKMKKANVTMTKLEVINAIKSFTGNTSLEQVVYGNTAGICTGAVLSAYASINVIREAIKIIVISPHRCR